MLIAKRDSLTMESVLVTGNWRKSESIRSIKRWRETWNQDKPGALAVSEEYEWFTPQDGGIRHVLMVGSEVKQLCNTILRKLAYAGKSSLLSHASPSYAAAVPSRAQNSMHSSSDLIPPEGVRSQRHTVETASPCLRHSSIGFPW